MLKELESQFSELENSIAKLLKTNKMLEQKYTELSMDYAELKNKYEAEHKENQVLAETVKNIKLYSAISGNPEHNRLMKNHINRLIKEVDYCILQLQNNGL